ncbi:hypothetical protein [Microbulbifer rhizosphaerae]|uniref:DUF3313 domain-containing protein n=1 Tax=Microbulbifer rhizosphaerae TaxID=1562603 RepID=A0A7W4Z9Z3_9GAMM|nr:hypothetical protein [Microbulbifer rhizosphaerae]MBB3062051.1 hypothetical protein [Microbulbifer rhizosphaerae]
MRVVFPLFFLFSVLLFSACTQQAAPTEAETADGLQPRTSGLDSVAAAFAFDLSGSAVYVVPVEIDYTKRVAGPGQPLRARDYELDARDRARLQELMAEIFSEKFLSPRNSQLVADPQVADYTLQLRLERFSLAAPLEPSAWLWRVYAEQSAYGVLVGELYNDEGKLMLRFRDRRDIGEKFGGLGPGRLERFTSVTFWNDMKVDLRRAFSSLDKTLR